MLEALAAALRGCSWEAAPLAAQLCAIKANPQPLGLLWLSSRWEGAVKEEFKWNSLVGKACLPSEELNSILFFLGFEC